jgi:hypothetical protein
MCFRDVTIHFDPDDAGCFRSELNSKTGRVSSSICWAVTVIIMELRKKGSRYLNIFTMEGVDSIVHEPNVLELPPSKLEVVD